MGRRRSNTDLLIIGGGAVGSLLASLAARAGWQTLLVEPQPLWSLVPPAGAAPASGDAAAMGEAAAIGHAPLSALPVDALPVDARDYALAAGSVQILEDLGYWSRLQTYAQPIVEIQVSQTGSFGQVRLLATQHQRPALGWVLSATRLTQVLRDIALESGVSFLEQTTLQTLEAPTAERRTALVSGPDGLQRVAARLIVAADGVRSPTRAAAGIEIERRRYAADALVCTVRPSAAHRGRAYERFTSEGPLALLPRLDGAMNVVWVAPPARVDERIALAPELRMAELQGAFGWRLGRLQATGPVQRFPLERILARRLYDARLVLVGNAAHGLHPVAGQGFNLCLRDVAHLAAWMVKTRDPGEPLGLAQYAAQRQPDIERLATITDGLARWLTVEHPGLRHGVGQALWWLDRLPPLRDALARYAMSLQPMPRSILRTLARDPTHATNRIHSTRTDS